MSERGRASDWELSDDALEDYYLRPWQAESNVEDRRSYELRLAWRTLESLRGLLLDLDRQDPSDLPADVTTVLSSGLTGLERDASWAVGVASVRYSTRMRRDDRLRAKRERGEI